MNGETLAAYLITNSPPIPYSPIIRRRIALQGLLYFSWQLGDNGNHCNPTSNHAIMVD